MEKVIVSVPEEPTVTLNLAVDEARIITLLLGKISSLGVGGIVDDLYDLLYNSLEIIPGQKFRLQTTGGDLLPTIEVWEK